MTDSFSARDMGKVCVTVLATPSKERQCMKVCGVHTLIRLPLPPTCTNSRQKIETSITCLYVSKAQAEQAAEKLKDRFSKSLVIKETRDLHSFTPVSNEIIRRYLVRWEGRREWVVVDELFKYLIGHSA